jgi:hypothetical protein
MNIHHMADLSQFAELLYASPPQPPHSILLDFSDSPCKPTTYELFQELAVIFSRGLQFFFASPNGRVNIDDLTEDQFEKINEYFHSFGFEVYLRVETEPVEPIFYSKSDEPLSHYKVYIQSKRTYIVWFDYLLPK